MKTLFVSLYCVVFAILKPTYIYGQIGSSGNVIITGKPNLVNSSKLRNAESSRDNVLGTVTALFESPDQICTNTSIQLKNTSTNATNYYWTFCEANADVSPEGVDLGNAGGLLNGPVFLDMAQDNFGNYFVLAVNNLGGNVVRLNFGSSLLNAPTVDNLGNFGGAIPQNTEGIQIENVNGKWIAIVAGGDPVSGNPSAVAKIDFGTSLASTTPLATNWGNIGGLNYPLDMFIFKESNNWYGYTVNSRNNTITRLNFGPDFSTTPTGTNLGNLGNLDIPTGLGAINAGGNWFVFIANDGNGTLTRLSFGNSLLNTPVPQNIGNPNGLLNLPRDISFIQFCNNTEAYVVNAGDNTIVKLDFGNDLLGSPTAASLGNTGNLNFPHSISKLFRVNNDIYSFIPNVNSNSISRLRFAGCNLPGSSLQTPTPLFYTQPGIYDINLQVDIGLPTQTSFCKQVVVTGCTQDPCTNWLQLPSSPSFVSVGDLDVPGNQITVEAEINLTQSYPGGPSLGSDIVAKYADPSDANYLLRAQNAQVTTSDGFFQTPDVCRLQINKIYHVAMVYDGDSLKFYRNGFLMSEIHATGNLMQNNWLTQIGFYQYAFYNTNFIGYINEVRIWNTARSQSEIQANMIGPLPTPTTQPGLLAYYSFNDLLNKQGNSAWNGTLSGSAVINASNPNCPFTPDNDCCPPISGTFTGNSICPGQTGMLTFVPVSTSLKPPYTLIYTDRGTNVAQNNVQAGVPFNLTQNPGVTTQYPLLKITDAAFCSTDISAVIATVTVFQPGLLILTPDTTVCNLTPLQLIASGGQTYNWFPSADLNNPVISNPIALLTQQTKLYVSGTDFNNCPVLDSVTISLRQVNIFKAPSNQSVCKGLSVTLAGNNAPTNIYNWSPAYLLDNANSPNPSATPDQTTIFLLHISDPVCPLNDSSFDVQVQVKEPPLVVASKSNDLNCATPSSSLTATGAISYSWLPVSGLSDAQISNPQVSVGVTTQYVVQGKNMDGCSGYDSITVVFSKTGENLFSVPNAFTPNNDGHNDCFGIRSWGKVTLSDFSIYNRWGQKVFETKNPSDCWDGNFGGEKQDAGAYVYIIKASSFCELNIVRTGSFLLIR